MKLRIPERFQAGGRTVTVKLVPHLIHDRDNIGEYCHRAQEIRLDATLNEQQREEVFLHELLEAVNTVWKLGLSHRQVTNLATALHQAFKTAEGDFGGAEEEKA